MFIAILLVFRGFGGLRERGPVSRPVLMALLALVALKGVDRTWHRRVTWTGRGRVPA